MGGGFGLVDLVSGVACSGLWDSCAHVLDMCCDGDPCLQMGHRSLWAQRLTSPLLGLCGGRVAGRR